MAWVGLADAFNIAPGYELYRLFRELLGLGIALRGGPAVEGNYEAAMGTLPRTERQAPELPDMGPERLARLRRAYAAGGARGYWETKLEFYLEDLKQHYVSGAYIALAYAHTGDLNTAFEWLKKAVDEYDKEAHWMNANPTFDVLRSDPRWGELVRRMGLTPVGVASSSLMPYRVVAGPGGR